MFVRRRMNPLLATALVPLLGGCVTAGVRGVVFAREDGRQVPLPEAEVVLQCPGGTTEPVALRSDGLGRFFFRLEEERSVDCVVAVKAVGYHPRTFTLESACPRFASQERSPVCDSGTVVALLLPTSEP